MKHRFLLGSFLLGVLFITLASCEDAGFSSGTKDFIEIQTLADGSFLAPGGRIPVEVFQGLGKAELLRFELYDKTENLLKQLDYKDLDKAIPPLELPRDLAEGFYKLSLSVRDDKEALMEKTLPFFIVSAEPKITRLVSNPPVFLPGGEGVVFAEGIFPADGESWIRWKLEDKVVQEAKVSQGGAQVRLKLPQQPGMYSLKAEIFPQAPLAGEYWDFSPPEYSIGEKNLVCNSNVDPGQGELPYEGSWYSLFHFYGETADWGSRPSPLKMKTGRNYSWELRQKLFGYRGQDSLEGGSFLFPLSSQGQLEPFSLCLVFFLEEKPVSRLFLETATADGGFQFRLFSDEDGIPGLSIQSSGFPGLALNMNSLEPWERGLYKSLIISVYPDYRRRELSVFWYQDGRLISSAKTGWNLSAGLTGEGSTLINTGEKGMDVLDELGIYYRDNQDRPSPVPDIFYTYSRDTYGNRLFYADGFDSLELKDELKELADYNRGEWVLLFNRLGLFSGGLFHLPGFALEEGKYSGSLVVSPDSGGNLFFQIRMLKGDESVLLSEIPLVPVSEGENQIRFEVCPNRQEVILNGKSFSLPEDGAGEDARLCWALNNRGEGMLFVQEVAIVKDQLQLEISARPEASDPHLRG